MAREARHGLVEVGSLSLSVKLKCKSADSRSVRPIFNLN